MTATSAANATIQATNLSIKAIGLSVTTTNLAYVTFTTNISGHACSPPPGASFSRVFFDYTTTKGKAIMSLLTAAHLAGKKVSVTGNNNCDLDIVEPGEAATQTERLVWVRVE